MEIQPISYKRVIYIINQLIIILDEIDNKIINEQKAYENKICAYKFDNRCSRNTAHGG